jgi:hypothetical protein
VATGVTPVGVTVAGVAAGVAAQYAN